ncbi:hypothetical protein ECDEC12A_3695 [Escherichia coli DEC12A]|nr:hypothetical protein ECE128010_0620 [Escherichia coli E128010]EHX27928.1 hypothetical protein ECDEC12A_3695 [Escherichia coli DEC12A]EHX38948.1 hypothetical protein ECDEC12D_5259 [Escherichia coli DEC12D]
MNNKILKGIEIVTGDTIIIPKANKILEMIKSIAIKGK